MKSRVLNKKIIYYYYTILIGPILLLYYSVTGKTGERDYGLMSEILHTKTVDRCKENKCGRIINGDSMI